MKQLILYGAGGHAREVAQLVRDINKAGTGAWELLGFAADPLPGPDQARLLPAPFLGSGRQVFSRHPDAHCLIAVGNSHARRSIVRQLLQDQPGRRFATLIHPQAWLADGVTPGVGSVVFARACINVDVSIGAHCSINLACTISHDCRLGAFTSLGPGVHLPGRVNVGEAADIGTASACRPGVRIGNGVVVGAGASVVHDLPDDCVAVGVPARSLAQTSAQRCD